jgi:hypothetical protein
MVLVLPGLASSLLERGPQLFSSPDVGTAFKISATTILHGIFSGDHCSRGVVTRLSAALNSNFSDHDLLFRTLEELQAAERRKKDVPEAFLEARFSTDPTVIREWYLLGVPLSNVSSVVFPRNVCTTWDLSLCAPTPSPSCPAVTQKYRWKWPAVLRDGRQCGQALAEEEGLNGSSSPSAAWICLVTTS